MAGGWPSIAITVLKGVSINGTTVTCIAHGLPASLFTSSGIRVYSIVVGPNVGTSAVVGLASVAQGGLTATDATYVYAWATNSPTICDIWVGPDTA